MKTLSQTINIPVYILYIYNNVNLKMVPKFMISLHIELI